MAVQLGTVPIVLGLALLLGATTAFATPALQAVIPALVPREDLGAAVAMNSVTFNLARALGPVAGAFVVARFGIPWAIASTPYRIPCSRSRCCSCISTRRARLRDSLAMLRQDSSLAILLVVVAAVSLTMDPVSTLTPAFATRYFHKPDTFAGFSSARGRIMALWSVAFLGTRSIAALIDGGLASVVGLRSATVIMALPTMAAVFALRIGPGTRPGPWPGPRTAMSR